MPKKRFSAEQIVTLLRQIEVSMVQGKSTPVCTENLIRIDWPKENHLTSVNHVRTVLFRPGRFGLAIQVEEPT